MAMNQDGFSWSNISATPASFVLIGGMYQVVAVGTWGAGQAILNELGPDGSTNLSVSSAITANGGQTLYLPPGTYQLAISGGATAVYASITRIPE